MPARDITAASPEKDARIKIDLKIGIPSTKKFTVKGVTFEITFDTPNSHGARAYHDPRHSDQERHKRDSKTDRGATIGAPLAL